MTAKQRGGLRILFVGPLPPMTSGSSHVCAQLLCGLVRLGHRVRGLAAVTPEAVCAAEAFASAHPELHLAWYQMPYFERFPNPAPKTYREHEGRQIRARLHALIDGERPDVVVIGREILAWHVPNVALAHGIPSVMLVHGGPSTQIIYGVYPKDLVRPLLDQFRKVNIIVAVAKHWARSLQTLGLNNVRSVSNPVDLERFCPQPKENSLRHSLDIDDDQEIVLHASNLQPEKRVIELIRSAERVLCRNPSLMYLVLGDGAGRAALESECRKSGVANRFRFLGWIDHDCMPQYLNLADVVVMPSESETQSLVYLETQACARPLLASDIPAAHEVVTNGETGLLFRSGSVDDLAAKTIVTVRDPQLRARIGRAARAYVEKNHRLEDIVATYEALLLELTERRRR